jgi:two-component system, sensor histidine kinase PdtaS
MSEVSEPDRSSGALDNVRRHMRILVDIGRLAGESSDLGRFLDQTVTQVARAVEIHHVKVLQYRPRTADLLVVAGIGWGEGVVGIAALSADLRSAPGRAFQTAEAVTIKNFKEQEEYIRSDFLKQHDIISLTNVPVLIDAAAWGVLEVDSTTPRGFSEDTTDFLTAVAALIGAFVRHHAAQPQETARLVAAAAEAQKRDVLLRELQHRVKNSFQLILASIAIQKRRHSGVELHRVLNHVASRINAISLAHDQLATREGGHIVKLSDYIHALCISIRQQTEEIEIEADCDELELSIDRAVLVGLILNEAAINSIKHAFSADGGRITVKLTGGVGYGEANLTVTDNGRGLREQNDGGSGLKLIASLARQIGGTIEQESSETGTTTLLRFPLIT